MSGLSQGFWSYYTLRVNKRAWYAAGGFTNSNCWRRQSRGGGWKYYINEKLP